MKALIIGCGNIGVLFDHATQDIKTHAKALSLYNNINVSVTDENLNGAEKAAALYNFEIIKYPYEAKLEDYQWVVVAAPTHTHYEFLKMCFKAKVPLIICEKPVAETEKELEELKDLYTSGNSKVLVNYIRRFQPAFIEVKKIIKAEHQPPLQIVIKYQRGILNNFSHAADLLQFFFGESEFMKVNFTSCVNDEFIDDPTVSFTAHYNNIPITTVGLANVKYSYFEMEIYYSNKKISILRSGNMIELSTAGERGLYYPLLTSPPEFSYNNLLKDYMKHVYSGAWEIYNGNESDNFLSSIQMNSHIIKIKNLASKWQN